MSQNIPAFAIFLGDILWDNLEMFPHIKQEIAKIQIPIYPVIGNHDHDKEVSDDDASAHLYRHFFGPTYYAFNAGKDYYIVWTISFIKETRSMKWGSMISSSIG